MMAQPDTPVRRLLARGVRIPRPEMVAVDDDVRPEAVAPGVTIHPGCRLQGASLSIGPGCDLGAEAPATVSDCQLGPRVRLQGGVFAEAVVRAGAAVGSAAQVRPGTLLEEQSSAAHAVGLKQTILFPWVTLGSLINFCDCLMAGGASRRDHGEVGSSYIHFNYTPHQDKATPSLIGDVPRGVMLDQPPVFLGGQGGLVGPARVAFGAVVPAGTIVRGDIPAPGLFQPPPPAARADAAGFRPGAYRAVRRLVRNNLVYIGNLLALRAWYRRARPALQPADPFLDACRQGALARLETVWRERLARLAELADKMPRSLDLAGDAGQDLQAEPWRQQRRFAEDWPRLRDALAALDGHDGDLAARDRFLAGLTAPAAADYSEAVRALPPAARADGTAWLQSIVDAVAGLWPDTRPSGPGH